MYYRQTGDMARGILNEGPELRSAGISDCGVGPQVRSSVGALLLVMLQRLLWALEIHSQKLIR